MEEQEWADETGLAVIDVAHVGTISLDESGRWWCDWPGYSADQCARAEAMANAMYGQPTAEIARMFGGTVRADTKGGDDAGRLHD